MHSGLYSSHYGSLPTKPIVKIDTIDVIPLKPEYDSHVISNIVTVTGIDNENIINYSPNGLYVFSASSTLNAKCQPYMAFNNSLSNYWQCDASGNADKTVSKTYNIYSQDPYETVNYGNNISPYVGGGDKTNTWSTTVNNSQIVGEWLQVQLPYSVYLYKYNILTPSGGSSPYLYVVVGSNDGNHWRYIDQQNGSNVVPDMSGNTNSVSYSVNSTEKFSYFRLIITEITGDNAFIQIVRWKLEGGMRAKIMIKDVDVAFATIQPTPIGTALPTTAGIALPTTAGIALPTTTGTALPTTAGIALTTSGISTTMTPTSTPFNTKKIETFTTLSRSMDMYRDSSIQNHDVAREPTYNNSPSFKDLGYVTPPNTMKPEQENINATEDPLIYLSVMLGVITISLYILYTTKK